MSFLTNLAKGFVRSTVNQVGRDTGKIISNKIYGDAHSTPIKGVRHENGIFFDETDSVISEKDICKMLYTEGYRRKFFTSSIGQKMFFWILGLAVTAFSWHVWGKYYALIPPSILILIAILKAIDARKNMYVALKSEIPMFKTDLRCKNGRRFVGYKMGEIDSCMPSTKSYARGYIIIASAYIFLAFYMYFTIWHFSTTENPFSWAEFGQYCIIPLATLIVLHIIFRK
jgi:hypothetical protein